MEASNDGDRGDDNEQDEGDDDGARTMRTGRWT
jgi:hypothetical protein